MTEDHGQHIDTEREKMAAAFDRFGDLYPLPAGFGWKICAITNRGWRHHYYLSRVDWMGIETPIGASAYYLGEFVAFLEALILAASDPVLRGLVAKGGGNG